MTPLHTLSPAARLCRWRGHGSRVGPQGAHCAQQPAVARRPATTSMQGGPFAIAYPNWAVCLHWARPNNKSPIRAATNSTHATARSTPSRRRSLTASLPECRILRPPLLRRPSASAHAPTQARPVRWKRRRLANRVGVGPHARIDCRVLRRHGALHQGGGELQRAGSSL